MKSVCSQFDQYRDRELAPAQRAQFEAHLAGCGDCRLRARLLDNMVRSLGDGDPGIPAGFAERVAAQAFERGQSWDAILLSWLPPSQAWVAATVALCIFAALVFASSRTAAGTSGKYESLMEESDTLVRGEKIQGYADFRAVVIRRGESYD